MREPDETAPLMASTNPARRPPFVPLAIGIGALAIIVAGATMVVHAEAQVNKVALDESAKPVTVMAAKATTFRGSRDYVGTIEPWVEAKVGPQMISAYVDTVLVRPGAIVKKGAVVATLDCRNANASSVAVAMQARAVAARQEAISHEASRLNGLLDGGFVSPNEAEQKSAQSTAEEAQVLATQAQLLGTSLQVNDCILRAPFDGEVATRSSDPGAFARPGVAIVSIVDRSTVRVVADAPEIDFAIIAPGSAVKVHVLATNQDLTAVISRRAPAADPATRTAHFEIDIADPECALPVGTTADIQIDIGAPQPATEIPLSAATVRGDKALLYVVDGKTAHKTSVHVLGEREGRLYLDTSLAPGSRVVTEGRALLNDNDAVTATLEAAPAAPAPSVDTKRSAE
ncbi:MAG TPA: efflux RND transporter periplasmic adaptor subunit [Polyangiaceae bacterium]|jgi:RND family efflux transporter MFP subunit|nr:efflux RND transporter periplasmic adaptor subunit [Polyangiaceae bacterium]